MSNMFYFMLSIVTKMCWEIVKESHATLGHYLYSVSIPIETREYFTDTVPL